MTTKNTIETKVKVSKTTKTKNAKVTSVPKPVIVPGELAFWTVDGQVYHSLAELADGLDKMEGRVYRYHADSDFQDFAKWVGTVLKEKDCAKELKLAKTAKQAKTVINKVLKTYSV